MIHTGDCIEVMRGMEADSVDAVVTDPPYGIEFMGKAWDDFKATGSSSLLHSPKDEGRTFTNESGHMWDNTKALPRLTAGSPFQAWCEAWGREALRVTKPGGYLLAFGGTRTHHRLVCGLEDAGWIIRDELDWIYASGFPKGKANLKPAHEPIVLARKPGPLQPLQIDECRISHNGDIANAAGGGSGAGRATANLEGPAYGKGLGGVVAQPHEAGRWPSNVLLSDPELFDSANPYVVGSGATTTVPASYERRDGNVDYDGTSYKAGLPVQIGYGDRGGYSRFFAIPRRGDANAEDSGLDRRPGNDPPVEDVEAGGVTGGQTLGAGGDGVLPPEVEDRGPAGQGDYPSAFLIPKADRADREPIVRGLVESAAYTHNSDGRDMSNPKNSMGGGERKRVERGEPAMKLRANSHPTVKPTDLMRHLVRLVTPPGGTVLDPFLGSGSTAIACELEGFPWIGIEKEPEYVAIAEARLNGTQRGLGLDVGAPIRRDIGKQRGNKDEEGRPTLGSNRNPELIYEFFQFEEEPRPEWEVRCQAAVMHTSDDEPEVCMCGLLFNERPPERAA